MRKQTAAVAGALALSFFACDQKPAENVPAPPAETTAPSSAPVELADLSKSLDGARAAFNARKGEPRFLTLLSPT